MSHPHLPLSHLTLQNLLTRNAKYRKDHLAFVFKDQRLTYGELNQEVNRLCHAMQAAGIKKGDKVATLLPNTRELYEIYWACAKLGAVAVPLSPLLRGAGLINLIQNSDSILLITKEALLEPLEAVKKSLSKRLLENIWLIDSTKYTSYPSYHGQKSRQPSSEPEVEKVYGHEPYNIIYSSGTTGV